MNINFNENTQPVPKWADGVISEEGLRPVLLRIVEHLADKGATADEITTIVEGAPRAGATLS